MPRFAANLGYLFAERPLLERFGAAAAAGFGAVELLFPYDVAPSAVKSELARHGLPKAPFYLTGQAGGQPFSVHAEGERMILTNADGRKEIDLLPPQAPASPGAPGLPSPVCPQGIAAAFADEGYEEPPAPGASLLDEGLANLREELTPPEGGGE